MSDEIHPSWQHQVAARAFARKILAIGPGLMLAIAMGGGKTKLAIDLIHELGVNLVLITCPMRVIEVWEIQLALHANFAYLFRGLDERMESVAEKARAARDAIAQARIGRQVCILAINYESARLEPFASLALNTAWPLIIADECVPPGTMIATPDGDVPIEEIHVGDLVIGYDHQLQRSVPTPVTHVFQHETNNPLIKVLDTLLTPNHPVWTASRGYVPAASLQPTDEVAYATHPSLHLRILQDAIPGNQADTTILLKTVQHNGPNNAGNSGQIKTKPAGDSQPPRSPAETPSALAFDEQSIPTRRSQGKGPHTLTGNGIRPTERRQWPRPNETAILAGAAAAMADGMDCADPTAEEFRLSIALQAGHRGTLPADCDRGRWSNTPEHSDSRGRRPQGRFSDGPRMDGAALFKSGSAGRARPSRIYRPVHNLETGTGNYFANGLLVHNCHRLKSPSGKISRFFRRLAMRARKRIGLTGTPLPHSQFDIWAQYAFLDPSIYDETFYGFKTRYAEMGGFQNRQVKKWRDMEDFNRRFYSIAFRVTKEEALPDLPPEMDQVLRADLSTKGRRIYDELERDFIAWLGETPEEELTVANVLVLYLRLQQLTGGSLKDDAGESHSVDTAKEDLLADWLEDLDPEEPAVVFAYFIPDLDAIARACQRAGRSCSEVSGRNKHGLAAWKEGKTDILIAQISVASEGQDLTRSRYVVYYSVGWKLSNYIQSRARIHRPGQSRPVVYYHLLLRGTIDEIILHALEKRWDLVESVLKELKSYATRSTIR